MGGAVAGGTILAGCGKNRDKLAGSTETRTVCPGCDMGCGIRIAARNGNIINVEGDVLHPVNGGSICPRGSAVRHIGTDRLEKVLHRKPGALEWEQISWDDALARISELVKETRDKTFITADKNETLNTCQGIAAFSGGSLSNEEYYLWSKFLRIMGVTALAGTPGCEDNPASTALGATFGYGAMTNTWNDIRHADVILVIGADPAKSHPVAVRHVARSRERGSRMVTVDPRLTRTAAMSDLHVPIRPGTDIAFINGLINYALNQGRIHREYVVEYTNASFLVDPSFGFKDGIFSGFSPFEKKYDRASWKYVIDEKGIPRRDRTLKDTRCVYRQLSEMVSRYTPETVSLVTGCPKDVFLKAAEVITSSGMPGHAGTAILGSGLTSHSTGTQAVRALAILQLLLGNMGRRGGGIVPLNGSANSQGMRDQGVSFKYLPGYLDMPQRGKDETLDQYRRNHIPKSNDPLSANEGQKAGRYLVSLLRAWFGDRAAPENDYAYDWLPRMDKLSSPARVLEDMSAGRYQGAFMLCTDPALSASRRDLTMKAMDKLSWLVCADMRSNCTADFWKREGVKPETIPAEVFLLPASSTVETEGSMTSGSRLVQWHLAAAKSPGDGLPVLDIVDKLFRDIQKKYRQGGAFPDPVLAALWSYDDSSGRCDPHAVAREINGYEVLSEKQIKHQVFLRDDGSTACGNRLYCGSYPGKNTPMARTEHKKDADPDLYHGWAWSWPDNSRILYNRASVDVKGNPWSPDRPLLLWGGSEWTGDVPDGTYPPGSKYPFTFLAEGAGRIFSPVLEDGPFPEHYEPFEAPVVARSLFQKTNPLSSLPGGAGRKFSSIITLFATADILSAVRSPWLTEVSPWPLCEISPAMASAKKLVTGDTVRITTGRGTVTARVLVTERVRSLASVGTASEMILLGGAEGIGLAHGAVDPSSGAAECRAFMADIEKVR